MFFFIRVAFGDGSSPSSVGLLLARDSDVSHSASTVWRTDAASDLVEAFLAFWVVHGSILLAALRVVFLALTLVPDSVTGSSAVGFGLQTVDTGVLESAGA